MQFSELKIDQGFAYDPDWESNLYLASKVSETHCQLCRNGEIVPVDADNPVYLPEFRPFGLIILRYFGRRYRYIPVQHRWEVIG